MIETVITFALLSAAFEFVLISKLRPRTRLRMLGSPRWLITVHAAFIISNLIIHFGTVTGSMTAVVAGLTSFGVMPLAKFIYGTIRANQYVPGLVRYQLNELA